MPAGRYYFGDPCYVFDNGWMPLLYETEFMEDYSNTKRVLRAASTAYGDGRYPGTGMFSRKSFFVDAGLLGFVPVSEMEHDIAVAQKMGTVVDMEHPFTFAVDNGVYLVDGNVIVDTSALEDEW
jgi:hypothetical protein